MVIRQLGPLELGEPMTLASAAAEHGQGSVAVQAAGKRRQPHHHPRQTPARNSTTWIMDVEQPSFITTD
jgi:hypothetical protein